MKKYILLSLSLTAIVATAPASGLPSPSDQTQASYTLQQLKDSALAAGFAMSNARLELDAAREQRREAFTSYFPSVSATGLHFQANREMARMDIDPQEFITPELGATLAQMLPAEALAALASPMSVAMMKRGTLAGITALQPIFTGGQIVLGNKLARIGEEAAALQIQLTENDVTANVEQYYWQCVSMDQKARTLDAVDEMLASIERDASAAVKAGVALRNDLLQVRLRQDEVQSQRLKLQGGRTLVKLLLRHACGLRDTCFTLTYDTIATHADAIPRRDHDAALLATPEYQLLEKNVEAARLQRRIEVGKRLPSVALGAGYNYHDLLGNDRHFGMLYATVSVPITDWWGGSHAIRRKRIAEQQARQQLDDNAAMLRIRMDKAWNDVAEAQAQLQLAANSEGQARENLRIHRDTYRAGTTTMSDLLQAQLLYQQACDRQTDAFITLQNALLAYRQATAQQ